MYFGLSTGFGYEGFFFWLISIWMITSWLQVISCGCRMAFLIGYLLRASFFKTTFNFRHRHCCKVSPSIGYPMDRRYFNQEATSAIFSKNFLTNFFFGLLFGLSRCLPIRGTIFRKPQIPKIFYKTPFFENRIVQSSGTSQKVLL